MIINTGCRTDIPAFYSGWFMNRIKEGYVMVRNPYNPNQVTQYSLDPKVVDCLAFCTKNPEPMLKYQKELASYKQYWFVTITPYGKDIEPGVPEKEAVIKSFQRLSKQVGVKAIAWRYDPIFIGAGFDVKKHIEAFEKMARKLKGYTKNCTISFLDCYEKVKRNATALKPPTEEEQKEIAIAFSKIGKENDMIIHSCCENPFLSKFGIDVQGCMTQEIVEISIGNQLNPPAKKNLRKNCQCLMGNDIGAYDSCMHLCKYCYANANQKQVVENYQKHIPTSPFLIGKEEKEDKVTKAKQKSWLVYKDQQMNLFGN